jgi:hypothetical protein
MRFPTEIVSGSEAEALAKTEEFVAAMVKSDFSTWTIFRPTAVRLDLDRSGTVTRAELVLVEP